MSYSHFSPDGNYVKPTHTFEEISVCPHCLMPTVEKFSGDEGWTFCSEDCGCLEGEKPLYKFECSRCGDLKDTEECNCK